MENDSMQPETTLSSWAVAGTNISTSLSCHIWRVFMQTWKERLKKVQVKLRHDSQLLNVFEHIMNDFVVASKKSRSQKEEIWLKLHKTSFFLFLVRSCASYS